MSRNRPCEECKRTTGGDGNPLEVCYSHILKLWVCMSCYFRGTAN